MEVPQEVAQGVFPVTEPVNTLVVQLNVVPGTVEESATLVVCPEQMVCGDAEPTG